MDTAKALLGAGALVTLRVLAGGPDGDAPLQVRLLYPLSISLLQQDFIVPRWADHH